MARNRNSLTGQEAGLRAPRGWRLPGRLTTRAYIGFEFSCRELNAYHQERLQPEASSFAAGHDRPHPLEPANADTTTG
jgi:hypothetical protein